MPTVVVPADPPVEGFVLQELAETTPLSAAQTKRLYEAMLGDVCRAIQAGGADLLVNYRPADQVPADVDPERTLRDVLDDVLEAPDEARYEVQVGETKSGRVGNSVTHLLGSEGIDSAAVAEPTAAFLAREHLGTAAMKLRSSDVVLGPTTGGRVYFAGFVEPIDFEGAYEPPAVATLADRAAEAGLDVDFLQLLPVVASEADLVTALSLLRARRRAERRVPPLTTATVEEFGLEVVDGDAVGLDSDRT